MKILCKKFRIFFFTFFVIAVVANPCIVEAGSLTSVQMCHEIIDRNLMFYEGSFEEVASFDIIDGFSLKDCKFIVECIPQFFISNNSGVIGHFDQSKSMANECPGKHTYDSESASDERRLEIDNSHPYLSSFIGGVSGLVIGCILVIGWFRCSYT